MNIYKLVPQFSPHTGKPVEPKLLSSRAFICDYTGGLYDTDENDGQLRVYTVCFTYDNSSEPAWYEDYHEFIRKLGVKIDYGDFSNFMESPYHFVNTEAYGCADASEQLMRDWMKDRKTGKGRFNECGSIEQVFRRQRLDMVNNLIKGKVFTLEQLGLTHRAS